MNIYEITSKFNELIYNFNFNTKYAPFIQSCCGVTSHNVVNMPPITTQGYVFFGKPKLNLTSQNIKEDRILSCLNTSNPSSLSFYIRCNLDPILAKTDIDPHIRSMAYKSPLIRNDLPFIPLLTNTISKLSGWNDPNLEIETTEGGFFSENISIVKGGEDDTKSISLTADFEDIQGNPVLMLFMIWRRWIMLSVKGVLAPYNKYDEENKISYSFSLYRFRLDTSGKYITYWSRGIGCIPTGYPISHAANYDKHEHYTLHKDISIPIQVNFPKHLDPIDLLEFNMWIKRWCPDIEKYEVLHDEEKYYFKHLAVPYIDFTHGKKELQWRINPSIKPKSPEQMMEELIKEMKKNIKK